jgi:translation initiation factor IF-3
VTRDEALQKAREENIDLVEIAASAQPPVVRLINFQKFKYQEAKKEREAARKTKKVDIKEIRLTPFIGKNDLNVRMERAKEFLTQGNKVRLVVRFTGRQMGRQQFGYEVIKKALVILESLATMDSEPKFVGRQLITVLTPLKG